MSRFGSFMLTTTTIAMMTTTAAAAPIAPLGRLGDGNTSLAEPVNRPCWRVCLKWLRPNTPGGHPKCWKTKRVCGPYDSLQKSPQSPPKVEVPNLSAKPKPWNFRQQSAPRVPSLSGRSFRR